GPIRPILRCAIPRPLQADVGPHTLSDATSTARRDRRGRPTRRADLRGSPSPLASTERRLTMPAPTLDGRLLCASGAAYAITGDEPTLAPDPDNVYLAGAGFVRPPKVLVGGQREIDACLVGEIADGVVIAFRGTLPF